MQCKYLNRGNDITEFVEKEYHFVDLLIVTTLQIEFFERDTAAKTVLNSDILVSPLQS